MNKDMILAMYLAPNQLRIGLINAHGVLAVSRDASWRVGSGQSLATHVSDLLESGEAEPKQLTAIAVSITGGSLTTLRSTLAFANAFAWARSLPLFTPQTTCASLEELAERCQTGQLTESKRLFPTYDPRELD